MKQLPAMQEIIDDGIFIGSRRSQGRVTVEPGFFLTPTGNTVGTSTRGPYRWWQRSLNDQVEIEIPGIKSIQIERSLDTDAATATITMYNHSMAVQESDDMMGAPGYYWPEHGVNPDAATEWNQVANDWEGIIVENALLRTYEGYGNWNEDGTAKSIQDGLNSGHLTMTGVWLVDKVTGGTSGMIQVQCRDMMKLLIEQILYPPLCPSRFYPVEYYPPGTSPWDTPWEPIPNEFLNDALSGLATSRGGTVSIQAHPTGKGYWLLGQDGAVYNYGPDTAHYGDASAIIGVDPDIERKAVSLAVTSDGGGYWIADNMGHIYAFGNAGAFGDVFSQTGSARSDYKVIDIARTHDDGGYWLIARDGTLYAFGNAPLYSSGVIPRTPLTAFYDTAGWWPEPHNFTATAIIGHPSAMGMWVVNGNGEVLAYGSVANHGQVEARQGLLQHEWTHGIEVTPTGNGYWIAFGSGHVASFGDAEDYGNATLTPDLQDLYSGIAHAFYFKLVLDIARSSDGRGFYVVRTDGTVDAIDCRFWGDRRRIALPGNPGTFSGDYADIVKELILWAGFFLYTDPHPAEPAHAYAVLESTGIEADTERSFSSEQLDKKPIIDIISMLKEVVAYNALVDSEGCFHFTSPNIYSAGNFLLDGTHTDEFITISEDKQMTDYSVSLDSGGLASEIIIGTAEPHPDNPATTVVGRHVPPTAPKLRGIIKPFMWVNENFTNQKEVDIMAELVALRIWFSTRAGSLTAVANPAIELDDQIRIMERTTSESYYHYVYGISTNHDLDTGEYTATYTTFRLGTDDEWAITADEPNPSQVQVSQNVVDWLAGDGEFNTRTRVVMRPTGIPGGSGD